jgi:uncharacterized BrkB/YihY/UPF0761 family membrane protein
LKLLDIGVMAGSILAVILTIQTLVPLSIQPLIEACKNGCKVGGPLQIIPLIPIAIAISLVLWWLRSYLPEKRDS